MEYQTTDFPTDPFQTSAPVQSTTVTGPKEFYQVVEAKDMFESVGFPSPWDEIPENKKQEYRDRHINALMAMAIYFIVVGIILVFNYLIKFFRTSYSCTL